MCILMTQNVTGNDGEINLKKMNPSATLTEELTTENALAPVLDRDEKLWGGGLGT